MIQAITKPTAFKGHTLRGCVSRGPDHSVKAKFNGFLLKMKDLQANHWRDDSQEAPRPTPPPPVRGLKTKFDNSQLKMNEDKKKTPLKCVYKGPLGRAHETNLSDFQLRMQSVLNHGNTKSVANERLALPSRNTKVNTQSENARGPRPKIEFLAFPLTNKYGRLGRIIQSWTKPLQCKPSKQRLGQKCADFQMGTTRVPAALQACKWLITFNVKQTGKQSQLSALDQSWAKALTPDDTSW